MSADAPQTYTAQQVAALFAEVTSAHRHDTEAAIDAHRVAVAAAFGVTDADMLAAVTQGVEQIAELTRVRRVAHDAERQVCQQAADAARRVEQRPDDGKARADLAIALGALTHLFPPVPPAN